MTSTAAGIVTYRGAVYASHCDHIGHMNIASYGAKFDEANWVLFCEIGLTPSYLRGERYGMAGVQQNITYRKELFAGDVIEIRSAGARGRRQASAVSPRDAQHRDGRGVRHERDHGGASRQAGAQVLRVSRGRARRGRGADVGHAARCSPPFALAVIAVTVLASSFVSGLFGMAGGMILLGVLLVFMDVAPAMVLFGIIQMVSNGWRATLWFRYVEWSIVWRFLVGSTLVFLLMRSVALLPSKATLYLTLGLLPFAAELVPKRVSLDITRPGVPYFAGALIIVLQLMAGAAGHILDVFFQKSRLDRKTIVATKAVTQVTGHVYRIIYFGSFG